MTSLPTNIYPSDYREEQFTNTIVDHVVVKGATVDTPYAQLFDNNLIVTIRVPSALLWWYIASDKWNNIDANKFIWY